MFAAAVVVVGVIFAAAAVVAVVIVDVVAVDVVVIVEAVAVVVEVVVWVLSVPFELMPLSALSSSVNFKSNLVGVNISRFRILILYVYC